MAGGDKPLPPFGLLFKLEQQMQEGSTALQLTLQK